MNRAYCWILLVAIFILATPVKAQNPPSGSDPLSAMLALVPDSPISQATRSFGVSYIDYKAVETAGKFVRPPGDTNFDTLSKDDQKLFFSAMSRVQSGPELSALTDYLADMRRLVGFGWFDQERVLELGTAPHIVRIVGGTLNTDHIGVALKLRGFENMDVDGLTVWYHLDDGKFSFEGREKGDPFGGTLGAAARLALLPNYVAYSRYWDDIRQVVAASKTTQKSLMDNPDYAALVGAITDPTVYEGSLLQASFIPVGLIDIPNPGFTNDLLSWPDLRSYKTLPPFQLGVLADRQENYSQLNLIALVYADAETAQQAADELQNRIQGYDIDRSFEAYRVIVDSPRVYKAANRRAVAVVSVRYPLPSANSTKASLKSATGIIFTQWYRAIAQQQFYPLMLKTLDKQSTTP